MIRLASMSAVVVALAVPGSAQFSAATSSNLWTKVRAGTPESSDYGYSDCVSENAVGLTNGGEIAWFQGFDTNDRGVASDTITEVAAANGSTTGTGAPAGNVGGVVVYDDPSGDNTDPTDLTGADIADSAAWTTCCPSTDTKEPVAVSGAVDDGFWLAAYMAQGPGEFPAAFDSNTPSGSRTWVAGSNTAFDPTAPGGGIGFFEMSALGFDSVWLVSGSGEPAGTCTPGSLATTITSNNGGSVDWMTLKDINVVNPNGVDITGFDINDNNAGTGGGGAVEIDVYITPGGLAGKETDPTQWTLVASGSATAEPEDTATFVDTDDFNLTPGLWGVGIHYRVGSGPAYTNGDGTNENYSNCDIDINGCCSITGLFTGTIFSPRVFNGAVYTCAVTYGGRTYCTAKTNSCGTVPAISGSGVPSAAASSGHVITGSNANVNRTGLLIYSDQGRAAVPFDGGFICVGGTFSVNPPVANSGGTANCDGQYSIDMNEYAGNASAAPFLKVPGTNVNVQWIGRDDTVTGSYLSDALEYCVGL